VFQDGTNEIISRLMSMFFASGDAMQRAAQARVTAPTVARPLYIPGKDHFSASIA